MMSYVEFAVAVWLAVLGRAYCALDRCNDGYQVAKTYTDCWTQSNSANRLTYFSEPHEEFTGKFVEKYAKHMCSTVKPGALTCLRKEMSECGNLQKIVEMADESGGTCDHNNLNAFFKLRKKHVLRQVIKLSLFLISFAGIIDLLSPVKAKSPCFQIGGESTCYNDAAKRLKTVGIPISKFHYEADKFFASIWTCQVELFKSKADICQNWQLPMLISLQQTAMPSLFGMKLTQEHVDLLELGGGVPVSPKTTPSTTENCEVNKKKVYILLKVLTQKPAVVDGDLVLQVNIDDGTGVDRNSIKVIPVPDKKKKEKQSKTQKGRKEKTTGRKENYNPTDLVID